MRVSVVTFGCKLNQYETQLMCQQLEDEYELVNPGREADFYIVNSCAVTAKAAKESRLTARRLHRKHPDARIIYTGCDSYLEDDLDAVLVGNSYKARIKEVLKHLRSDTGEHTKTYPLEAILQNYAGKARAFVKIQEGCDNHCTYCIIPYLRGSERDKPVELVLEEIQNLKNFGEVVLTGTNIGSYRNLKELLKRIDALNLPLRVRISSIEPMYVDDEFIEIIAGGGFAKHLHIPLQSGSNAVLRLMGRNYKREDFERIALKCHKHGIFLGTDVIVGFYGETDSRFKETCSFIESIPISFGHVFSYSKRPHTPAARLNMPLERGPVVRERNAILKEIFKRKFRESVGSMVGRGTTLVVEPTLVKRGNRELHKSVASQYFPVLVERYREGLVSATIKYFDGEYAYA